MFGHIHSTVPPWDGTTATRRLDVATAKWRCRVNIACAAVLLALLSQVAQAQLNVASVFSDHAVIQRDKPLIVWGMAKPKANVSVTFGSEAAETVAGGEGRWRVTLKEQPASVSPQTLVVRSDGHAIRRTDILIGDVWHASGQSNMRMTMGAVLKSLPEVEQLAGPFDQSGIRFFKIDEGPSRTPRSEFSSGPQWTECSDDSVRSLSAAAFCFAATIHADVGVPIGIIDTARGGTPIEPFIPVSAFGSHPVLQRERQLGDKDDLDGIWRLPGGVRARNTNWLPGRLFNSRVAPILEYAVRGCIWYQGESNCGVQEDPRDYQHKMRALIQGWRQQLQNEELPFYFVQLPGYGPGSNWPYLREQQRLAADVANSGMVVTIDLEHPDIHPPNKFDVGNRLAKWALARHYGRHIAFSGPSFARAKITGGQVVVEFAHADSGLMVANKSGLGPAVEEKDGVLNHFEITTDGGAWHPAKAVILEKTVVVSNAEIVAPIAVRYAYSPAPTRCNLFNRDGLPASPFCSRPELLECDPGLPK